MTQDRTTPNELGTESIGKLLRKFAVPGIIAMTASSLYNMVDSVFIGHIPDVGSLAISGLAVTFPLMNLSTALGTLVGMGAATLLSVLLGQKNHDAANKVLANHFTLTTIIGVAFAVFCLLFLDPILGLFGASEKTLPFAREYMRIILYGNVITHLYFGLNNLIRSSGNPRLAMGLTLFTVIFNTILDPILIFTFGMGIQGAAIATVISQAIALTYSILHFTKPTNVPRLPKRLKELVNVDWKVAKSSLTIGLGPFLMNSAQCLVTMFINRQLLKYGGDLAIGSFGIVNRINFLFIMIIMGLNQGMQPIVGYNFGARNYSRVKQVFKNTVKWACFVCVLWFVFSEFFPWILAGLFTDDPELKGLAIENQRIMNPVVLVVGWQMVSANLFQSLGMIRKSILLSLSRQLLFLIPLIYVMPIFMGVKGVFFAFPCSDAVSFTMAVIMIIGLFRKFAKLKDGDEPTILGSNIR